MRGMWQDMSANGTFEDWNVTYQWGSTGLIGDSQLDEDFKGQAKGFPQQDPIQY